MVSDKDLFLLVFAVILAVCAWWRAVLGLLVGIVVYLLVGWEVLLSLILIIGIPLLYEILEIRSERRERNEKHP